MKRKIEALQLSMEGLLKLLGGNAADREKFWEKVKGITTPQEMRLVENLLDNAHQQVTQAETATKTLLGVAAEAGKAPGGAAKGASL